MSGGGGEVHGFRFAALGSSGHLRIAGVARGQAEAWVVEAVR